MKRKTRLLIYAIVGLPIPIGSYLLYPELGIWEPVSFVCLVALLAAVIEVVYKKQGKV